MPGFFRQFSGANCVKWDTFGWAAVRVSDSSGILWRSRHLGNAKDRAESAAAACWGFYIGLKYRAAATPSLILN